MKPTKPIIFSLAGVTLLAAGVIAGLAITQKTFRTPTAMLGVYQGEGLSGEPVFAFDGFNGRDLVNLALGTPLGTPRTNEVLAMEIDCGSPTARLVVYDKTANSNLLVIAESEPIDLVGQKDNPATPYPNRTRFVAQFEIQTLGNETDGLTGGYLTMAGRIRTDPQTGCPEAVLVDRDKFDKLFGDREVKSSEEADELVRRCGLGHYIGVLRINASGAARTVLVPRGVISIRRQLPQGAQ